MAPAPLAASSPVEPAAVDTVRTAEAARTVEAARTRREQRALEQDFGIPGRSTASTGSRSAGLRRLHGLGARLLTLGAMAFVALLTVGMSIPASAFGNAAGQSAVTAAERQAREPQRLSVSATASDETGTRDSYAVTTAAQYAAAAAAVARAQAAAAAAAVVAAHRGSYNPTGTGPVRWPFPSSVPLGPGFGAPSTCRGCQAVHQGQDFLAGEGASIYAIADGVVTAHDESGSLGNHLTITHTIGGQTVTSMYAHMQSGSSPLRVGDHVAVGQFVGSVGQTGAATAPHLHLEIQVNGAHVDPYLWLQAHAG